MTGSGEVEKWTTEPPQIDVARLLGVHKYKDMSKVRPVILKAAEKAASLSGDYSQPEAVFTTIGIRDIDEDGVELENGSRLNCRAFSSKLEGCTALLVFVITLGSPLDEAVSAGFADGADPLGPLFLDTGGWLMIEAVTREFSRYLKEERFGGSHSLSIRMAPGYSYRVSSKEERVEWDLLEQQKLFGVFTSADLPVELLESGAMIPRMSRSGIFGVRTKP